MNIGVNEAFTKLVGMVYDRLYGNIDQTLPNRFLQPANQNGGWFKNLFGRKDTENNDNNDYHTYQDNNNVNVSNTVTRNNNHNPRTSGCC